MLPRFADSPAYTVSPYTRGRAVMIASSSSFMPLLSATLLIMNNRKAWVKQEFRSHMALNAILGLTLVFFGFVGYRTASVRLRLLLTR